MGGGREMQWEGGRGILWESVERCKGRDSSGWWEHDAVGEEGE